MLFSALVPEVISLPIDASRLTLPMLSPKAWPRSCRVSLISPILSIILSIERRLLSAAHAIHPDIFYKLESLRFYRCCLNSRQAAVNYTRKPLQHLVNANNQQIQAFNASETALLSLCASARLALCGLYPLDAMLVAVMVDSLDIWHSTCEREH